MIESSNSNIPNLLVMIRPMSFGYNRQTAESNKFQKEIAIGEVSQKALIEFDNMVDELKNHKISVLVFEDSVLGLPDSVFSNNWMAHLPENKFTIFPMLTENRRAEIRMDIIKEISACTKCDELIDLRDVVNQNEYLEGTGSIVFDYRNKIAYAAESPRTNILLFEAYCKKINYTPVSFESIDVKGDQIYHTNVILTVADRFAIVCFDSIQNALERKMLELKLTQTGHELIEISFQQMNLFAGNCLEVLNEDSKPFLLMSQSAEKCLSENQKKSILKYGEILSFNIPTIETIGGGSVRCMLTGIFC